MKKSGPTDNDGLAGKSATSFAARLRNGRLVFPAAPWAQHCRREPSARAVSAALAAAGSRQRRERVPLLDVVV